MDASTHTEWLALSPSFCDQQAPGSVFREHAERLSNTVATVIPDDLSDALRDVLNDSLTKAQVVEHCPLALRAALYILTDLAHQRWLIRVTEDGAVEVKRPESDQFDPRGEKVRVRQQELVKRNEQLREPAVRKFIEGMERSVPHRNQPVSVFSLFRDGRELAASLRNTRSLPTAQRADGIREALDPYLQFVDPEKTCQHTGLRLQEIWRYFRHTWTNHYPSTPGRWMAILVRDRARNYHPVIGIGAIGSPIVQIRERDAWIGWHAKGFLDSVTEASAARVGRWLFKIVNGAIEEIFAEDLIEQQVIDKCDIREPTPKAISRLQSHGNEQRALHHRFANARELKSWTSRNPRTHDGHWRERALTHLYRSKRALSLAEMLRARLTLRESLGDCPTTASVDELLRSRDGRRIVRTVLRKAKADRVGIAMADITVCGAVAPYNQVLGGKLVSMLVASPEVTLAYRNRYATQESEIASAMAGRPVVRPSQLVLLGTTSLYGVGSSQYNRLRMPAEALGGRPGEHLEYRQLGKSESYGTSHLGAALLRRGFFALFMGSFARECVSPVAISGGDIKQASACRRLSGSQPSLTAPNTFGLLPDRRAPFWTFARRSGTVPWEGRQACDGCDDRIPGTYIRRAPNRRPVHRSPEASPVRSGGCCLRGCQSLPLVQRSPADERERTRTGTAPAGPGVGAQAPARTSRPTQPERGCWSGRGQGH